jgi:hypothetical protein
MEETMGGNSDDRGGLADWGIPGTYVFDHNRSRVGTGWLIR